MNIRVIEIRQSNDLNREKDKGKEQNMARSEQRVFTTDVDLEVYNAKGELLAYEERQVD